MSEQPAPALLRPCRTATRRVESLDGFWRFALDPEEEGEVRGWAAGLGSTALVAVPGAWNEQLLGGLSHVGVGWYERTLELGPVAEGRRLWLRFDAAALTAHAWFDGEPLGSHEGGFLPFAFDITDRVRPGREQRLVVRVEHGLSPRRTPVGGGRGSGGALGGNPSTGYDFFPFGGLIRPVRLLETPAVAVGDLTVVTRLEDGRPRLEVEVATDPAFTGAVEIRLRGENRPAARGQAAARGASLTLEWDAPLWSPETPHLETLEVRLLDGADTLDVFTQPVGARTVEVEGDALLLNGRPVFLKGFGKHEDFPVFGRGLAAPVVVRDAELMRWVGANSYRTSHYPYAEEALDLADQAGLMVISETSAVGLTFANPEDTAARLDYTRAELAELVRRDRNHPSVIAWSVANEPFAKGIFGGAEPKPELVDRGVHFLTTLLDDARRLDPTRPVTVVGAQGHPESFISGADFISINRYYGWYSETARLDEGARLLAEELDGLHARHGKPILVAEFGADTLPGFHSAEAEMWSEEFQADMLERYLDEIERRPFVVGAHVWNFADFKTGQSVLRAASMNHKGVFTRDRRPKLAAHLLRRRWTAG